MARTCCSAAARAITEKLVGILESVENAHAAALQQVRADQAERNQGHQDEQEQKALGA